MRNGLKIGWLFLAAVSVMLSAWLFAGGVARAETITDADGFTYDTETGVLSGYSGTGENITIPADVTTIQSNVFSGNTNISSVNLNNTQIIEAYAFRGATKLSSVSGGSSVTQIGTQAFSNTNLSSFSIPSSLIVLAQNAFSGTNISGFNADSDNNGRYRVYGSSIYSDDGKTLFIVPEGYTENVVVSENATKIANGALSGAKQVTDIYIPASVTTIEDGATTGSGVIAPDGTIYGYTGTEAETYANDHSIRFVSLNPSNNSNSNNNSNSGNGNSGNSNPSNSGGTTTYIYYDDDDDDDDDDEDDEDTEYNDREYDVDDDDGDLNEVTELPNTGSGYAAANNHSLDSTPTTADGDIDPKFVFCVALFLIGLAGLIFARQRSLIRGMNREDGESDELD